MRLLFDENLSPRLVERLSEPFPGSVHVRSIGMKSADDPFVWRYAEENGLIIVSKDADMHDLSLLRGAPPKVIWIRLGNCSTSEVEHLLRRELDAIQVFYREGSASLLALSW